jgi:hypothetical protein
MKLIRRKMSSKLPQKLLHLGMGVILFVTSLSMVPLIPVTGQQGTPDLTPPIQSGLSSEDKVDQNYPATPFRAFLPEIQNGAFFTGSSRLPLLVGVYPSGWPGTTPLYTDELAPLDQWLTGSTSKRSVSLIGYFVYFSEYDDNHVANVFNLMWNHGYTPFVNVNFPPGVTANSVANGTSHDAEITNWARSFKIFAQNGDRFAFIAPMQEMNGYWVDYGRDPVNFKKAYAKIQRIFKSVGVPDSSVSWVFAPNGWGRPTDPPFEDYYPGDATVNVVAISAYNFGGCPAKGAPGWQDPPKVFNDSAPGKVYGYYLNRLRAMAPAKPIFIAQTATTNYYGSGINEAMKDAWLSDAYNYLKAQANVMGVVYYEYSSPKCNFAFFGPGVKYQYNGLKNVISQAPYGYSAPADVMATATFFSNTP